MDTAVHNMDTRIRECGVCGWAWKLRVGQGEPKRCPNGECRSKRWKEGPRRSQAHGGAEGKEVQGGRGGKAKANEPVQGGEAAGAGRVERAGLVSIVDRVVSSGGDSEVGAGSEVSDSELRPVVRLGRVRPVDPLKKGNEAGREGRDMDKDPEVW